MPGPWTAPRLDRADLEHVAVRAAGVWSELDGARLFVTGGTGFVGRWLLESLLFAADEHGLDITVDVLTRDRARLGGWQAADDPRLRVHEGDVRTFAFPTGRFTHVIHAATDASARLNKEEPLAMFETIVAGTRRTLELARRSEAKAILYISSGAIYGRQPPELTHVAEDHAGGPDPVDRLSAYAEGKRAAEQLCAACHATFGLPVKIARCFAFVGPHLPLDRHFAIGNFVADAIAGRDVVVRGDGTPYRSYLHAADLAAWLWTILVHARPMRPYNVGSENGRTIAEIARLVARVGRVGTRVDGSPRPGRPTERYVPSTARARGELGLAPAIELEDAIARTLHWYGRASG